jgi:hypothetical protein
MGYTMVHPKMVDLLNQKHVQNDHKTIGFVSPLVLEPVWNHGSEHVGTNDPMGLGVTPLKGPYLVIP